MNPTSDGTEDLGAYQVTSRREIIALLRSLREHNQLVRMIYGSGNEAVVTSVLSVNENSGYAVIDSAPGKMQNARIIESTHLSFETSLDRIRIIFSAEKVEACDFDGLPALRFLIPATVIRLQRREFYRVPTPRVAMHVPIPQEEGEPPLTAVVAVQNISAGGIGFVDEKMLLDNTPGKIYDKCSIAIPGGSPLICKVEIRNSMDVTLTTGKVIRRIGVKFIELPKPMLAVVQKWITKIERDQNAKSTGLA
jgi:c-di-GMP-binding flagellar brake protein YcgR